MPRSWRDAYENDKPWLCIEISPWPSDDTTISESTSSPKATHLSVASPDIRRHKRERDPHQAVTRREQNIDLQTRTGIASSPDSNSASSTLQSPPGIRSLASVSKVFKGPGSSLGHHQTSVDSVLSQSRRSQFSRRVASFGQHRHLQGIGMLVIGRR
jgi:hypothetical protein